MFTKTIFTLLATAATLFGTATASPVTVDSAAVSPATNGKFTHYSPGLGACGQVHAESDMVVALNYVDFDPSTPNGNPSNNALCGRKIRASYNGKSVDVTVVDRCPGCPQGGLDLSPAAFKVLAPLEVGVIQGSWEWI